MKFLLVSAATSEGRTRLDLGGAMMKVLDV
jgi:hypothetical protein